MINDIMSIVPIRVWLFWIIFLQAVIIFLGIKAYRQLLTDNRALAQLMAINKEKGNIHNESI